MVAVAALLLFTLIALGLHVAVALGVLGYSLSELFGLFPMLPALGEISWSASVEFLLVAIPMFVLMGEILLRAGVTENMYRALDSWLHWLPGGLMHSNVAATALFAATSGSSVATAATIGTISIPNIERRRYNPALFLGTLAAGGTLGILIPPSVNLIIYGLLSETSVVDLYLAGFLPGFLLAGLFSLIVLLACLLRPEYGGTAGEERYTWRIRFANLRHVLPPIGLFLVVVGSIYAGIATPTEAAALGVVAAVALAAVNGRLTWDAILRSCEGTMRTTCMVMLIILAALFLNFVMVGVGLTQKVTGALTGLGWAPLAMLVAIIVFYLVLGCVMETLSMMIATTAVIVPVIVALGYDKVWWGIVFMVLTEAALITPPIGLNLYVVQSLRPGRPFGDVVVGVLPFLGAMLVMIALLIAEPGIALWLPTLLKGQ